MAMSSLTIRLNDKTETLLNNFLQTSKQTKSEVVRASLEEFLQRKKDIEDQKKHLAQLFTIKDKQQVTSRILESEASYQLNDAEYEKEMDHFFARELGLIR